MILPLTSVASVSTRSEGRSDLALSPLGLYGNWDRGQRASFGSFRIAVILRLWATVLMVEIDVCMVTKRLILFVKRFRSKASSAAPLPPVLFVTLQRIGFDFLPSRHYDTVSLGRGRFDSQPRRG
jgi:hypothetical protein